MTGLELLAREAARRAQVQEAVAFHFEAGVGRVRRAEVVAAVADELDIAVVTNKLHLLVRCAVEQMGAVAICPANRRFYRGLRRRGA